MVLKYDSELKTNWEYFIFGIVEVFLDSTPHGQMGFYEVSIHLEMDRCKGKRWWPTSPIPKKSILGVSDCHPSTNSWVSKRSMKVKITLVRIKDSSPHFTCSLATLTRRESTRNALIYIDIVFLRENTIIGSHLTRRSSECNRALILRLWMGNVESATVRENITDLNSLHLFSPLLDWNLMGATPQLPVVIGYMGSEIDNRGNLFLWDSLAFILWLRMTHLFTHSSILSP